MKTIYRRKSWFLKDGILYEGYKDKYGFHPDGLVTDECGFSLRRIKKGDNGKSLFFNIEGLPFPVRNNRVVSIENVGKEVQKHLDAIKEKYGLS